MKNNIGRNDICPCGSGKKYKKCCQEKISHAMTIPVNPDWLKLSNLKASVMDNHLVPYIMKILGEKLEKEEIPEDNLEDSVTLEDIPEGLDQEAYFENFLIPALLFNRLPEGASNNNNESEQLPLAEPFALQYVKQHGNQLTSQEKEFIEVACETHYSFYTVLKVIPGQAILFKDIFLDKECYVLEREGTKNTESGDIIFGRVLTFDEHSILIGWGPDRIPEYFHNELAKLRHALIKIVKKSDMGKTLTSELLKNEFSTILVSELFSILNSQEYQAELLENELRMFFQKLLQDKEYSLNDMFVSSSQQSKN